MRSTFFISRTFIRHLTASMTVFMLSGHAQAQLQALPGAEFYNQTQVSVATAIQSLADEDYSGFNSVGVDESNFSSVLEEEMVQICREYNTNVRANVEPTEQEARDIASLLNVITHEEVGANGSQLTDTAVNPLATVIGRVQSLRGSGLATSSGIDLISGGAAGDDFSRLSYFVNANVGTGSKDGTSLENGFDFDSYGITGGVDYRFSDQFIAGVALALGQSEVDIDDNLGDSETDSVSLTFYGSYFVDNWFVDGVVGFSDYEYDNQRNLFLPSIVTTALNQSISSDTDGDAIDISIGGGYNGEIKGWQVTYSARLDYKDATIDSYDEDQNQSLALSVGKQDIESLQLTFGAQVTKSFSKKWGTINPFIGLELRNEFEDDTRVVTAQYFHDRFGNTFSFTSDDADSNYFLLSIGTSFVFSQGRQAFVSFDTVLGLTDVDSNTLTAGIRF